MTDTGIEMMRNVIGTNGHGILPATATATNTAISGDIEAAEKSSRNLFRNG